MVAGNRDMATEGDITDGNEKIDAGGSMVAGSVNTDTAGNQVVGSMIKVGQITKTFGSEGELIANLFEDFPRDYNIKEPLFVVIDGLMVSLFCDRFERRGQSRALIVFGDMDNERRASELIGLKLLLPVEDEEAESDGRIYLEDLEGMKALVGNAAETLEGTVKQFIDGENPLLLLDINGREVFVPAVEEFIVEVDIDAGTVTFDLPSGLLELYMD